MVRAKHSLSAGTLRGLLRHVYDDLDGQRFHTAQCLSIGIGRRRAKMKIRGVWGTSDFQFILYLFSVNLNYFYFLSDFLLTKRVLRVNI